MQNLFFPYYKALHDFRKKIFFLINKYFISLNFKLKKKLGLLYISYFIRAASDGFLHMPVYKITNFMFNLSHKMAVRSFAIKIIKI